MIQSNCIFCKIISHEIETEIVKESNSVIVFRDQNPSAEKHFLVVPKVHIASFMELTDKDLLWEMDEMMRDLISDTNLNNEGYRVMFNGGSYQHVPHVHWHLLVGKLL